MADTPAFLPTGRRSQQGAPPGDGFRPPAVGKLDLLDHILILRAVMLRAIKLRSLKMGAFGPAMELLMPIVVMMLHYFVFIALNRFMPSHIPVEYFVLGGFTTWFAFRNPSARVFRGEEERGPIFIPGVRRQHFLVAGVLWECAVSMFLLFSGLLLSTTFLGSSTSPNVLQIFFIFIVASTLGVGYRLFFDAVGYIWMPAKAIKKPLTWFAFITSGIYFAAQSGGGNFLATCGEYNPLMYLIEPTRQALWPEYPVYQVNFVYPVCCAVGLLVLGWGMKSILRDAEHK